MTASDPEGDAGDAPQPVTSRVVLAAVDMMRMYLSLEARVGSHLAIIGTAVLKRAIAKRLQGTLGHVFQEV